MVLLLFQLHICCLNTLEGVRVKVVFLISISHHFIAEGPLRQIFPVFIGGKVDIVAPFRPPGGADEELAIVEATKVCLKYERVLELSYGELLLALKCILDRLLEVLKEKLLDDLLLLPTAQVLAEITADRDFIFATFTLAAFLE